MKMNFGVHMPIHGLYDYKTFIQTSILADRLGYDYITVGDHFFLSPEFHERVGDDPNKPQKLDAWITLAALAAQTNRSKLGTRVSPLPFYLPGRLAKMVTTVDIISNGRVIFGAGAAGHRTEGIAYGVGWWRHKERIKRMIEEIEIILKLWKENEATYKGRFYSVTKAPFWPKPIQEPHPPIWFGGSGDSMVKATVKYGEGIFPFPNMPLEKLEDLNKRLREEEKKKGRTKPVILAPSLVYPDGTGKTHSQWIEKIQEQKNIGAELIMFDLSARAVPPEESQKFLKDFAKSFLLKE